ncbi:MAG: hypothetical protein QOE57_703, partial [Acidimicrobiaceae bacterium]|nr:hypothetical protein [Acidimicrobiaceae bacterium]
MLGLLSAIAVTAGLSASPHGALAANDAVAEVRSAAPIDEAASASGAYLARSHDPGATPASRHSASGAASGTGSGASAPGPGSALAAGAPAPAPV